MDRSAKELNDELSRLMAEHIESVQKQTYVRLDEKELQEQEERLKRIREVSADYLLVLKRKHP